ncbi:SRPBCC domain-containing protein [Weissella muntiaci]|uniref:SRPBCC domain-containing protein n=1 Tax=Weissella muntiaci TaxID=2508881 RepID=A0A6C2CBU4_9LACO|nr:SRPBCC domain-containing protein [Weissella muntiaci]TYC51082.1 SRPBCC domain-containing protein [Weissella muntiaci]
MLHEINWPSKYLPGTTDNFVSNEIIVSGTSVKEVWNNLVDTSKWGNYFNGVNNITVGNQGSTSFTHGVNFHFEKFGFPIDGQIMELIEPIDNKFAQIAWHGWQEVDGKISLEGYQVFTIDSYTDSLVRIITKESQLGEAAAEMSEQSPNPMLNGHQEWLDSLAQASKND